MSKVRMIIPEAQFEMSAEGSEEFLSSVVQRAITYVFPETNPYERAERACDRAWETNHSALDAEGEKV